MTEYRCQASGIAPIIVSWDEIGGSNLPSPYDRPTPEAARVQQGTLRLDRVRADPTPPAAPPNAPRTRHRRGGRETMREKTRKNKRVAYPVADASSSRTSLPFDASPPSGVPSYTYTGTDWTLSTRNSEKHSGHLTPDPSCKCTL